MATTSEQIVIRGDLVQVEQVSVLRTLALADLIPLIAVPPPITFPRMPNGARFVHMNPSEGRIALIVEVLPRLQSMNTSRHANTYRLSMPYQYYAFTATSTNFTADRQWRMENWYLFWAREPVTSPQSEVIPALLPNIYQDRGAICFGTTQPPSDQSLSQRIDQIVNEFSVTTFSGDLGWNRPQAYRSFAHWQSESAREPLAWRNWHEWTRGRPLVDYLAGAATAIRPATVIAEGVIPAIVTGWTFGRAFEWLQQLQPTDRYRLVRALHDHREELALQIPDLDPDDYPQEGEAEVQAEIEAEGTDAATVLADEVGTLPAFIDLMNAPLLPADEDMYPADEREEELEPEFVAVVEQVVREATAVPAADPITINTPRCACDDNQCSCERVVLAWNDTCAACARGRHHAA